MKDRDIKKATKIKIAETIIFLTVTYGSESWTVRNKEIKKIDAFEQRMWRRILWVLSTERRTNVSVLEEMQPKRPREATTLWYYESERVIGTGYYAWASCRTQEAGKTTNVLAWQYQRSYRPAFGGITRNSTR